MRRMMDQWRWVCCFLWIWIGLSACGHKSMVVLVPDPDGSVGRVTVSNAAGTVDIDRANQATSVRDPETAPGKPAQLRPEKIQDLFGKALANPLPQPMHFILHFQSDSVAMLPESLRLIPEIVAEIRRRAPTHISVVGHSDTQGDKAYNVDLSTRRAFAVKQLLKDSGVDDTAIDVSSHGEANPLVKTADNVANAENRRVEVVVR